MRYAMSFVFNECVLKVHYTKKAAMIWSDVTLHNPSTPPSPPTWKIQICTNPKFPTTQKYIIKSKVEEENNSPFVVVVVDSSFFFCLFCYFFSSDLFLIHSHTHTYCLLHTPKTPFSCVCSLGTRVAEKRCVGGVGGDRGQEMRWFRVDILDMKAWCQPKWYQHLKKKKYK